MPSTTSCSVFISSSAKLKQSILCSSLGSLGELAPWGQLFRSSNNKPTFKTILHPYAGVGGEKPTLDFKVLRLLKEFFKTLGCSFFKSNYYSSCHAIIGG